MNQQQIYQQALDKFGIDIQLLVLIEEMSELTKEIIKKFRNTNFDEVKLYEELVDVKIVLAQIELYFQNSNEDYLYFINKFTKEKLERLNNRINDKIN